jgi:hypothetical protein
LSNNGFNGTIPSELSNIVSLKYFYVENNNMTGTIPTEIGSLLQLERLVLSGNSFRGTVPSAVATLMNLGEDARANPSCCTSVVTTSLFYCVALKYSIICFP